ncbi:TIGR01457 family HAD-type hydrolase [Paenibacillus oenotherae]|uniref:Acid sugar phosphatase n=1 Tax=Paenibacillus oenotherae TaxID=1435645 RepID=A0ABS7DCF3_9BACL|nr:TIGR01457 family HAD-type hydrolase [Paenibacillus oenotherae]MBW7477605.1 TIGR01457 family HAD-type hydrolase [Paenibacillus oenotherae]
MDIPAIKGLLIDLDGTLYKGHTMIEGADALIHTLRELGTRFLFVTNNSSATPEKVAERLNGMGIPAQPHEVCTSAQAAAFYIAKRLEASRVFTIGEEGLRFAVMNAGLQLVEENPDVVLQGIDRQLTYSRLSTAVGYIRQGATYILTNPDVLLPSDGGFIPGAGSISALLQTASGVRPTVIGKPSAILMDYALEKLALPAEDTWVVGDNPATDIAAGNAAGCRSILVLTGLATQANYSELLQSADCKADAVFDNLHILLEYIRKSAAQ